MKEPPRTTDPRRRKNKKLKAHLQRASDQTGPYDRRGDESGLKLAVSQPGQRERERERRVSDADASYYAGTVSTRTLKHVIPQ